MATFLEIAARSVSNFSHCILSICNIYLFPVLVCLLIATVPVHCFSITFRRGTLDVPAIHVGI